MGKFVMKAGFKGQDVGGEYREDVPEAIERAYRTYVMTGFAAVMAKASVELLTNGDPQTLVSRVADDAARILKD
jgi:hypothetical protein